MNHATWRRSAAAAEEQKAFLLRENAEHERAINELLSKAGSVSAENAQLKQVIITSLLSSMIRLLARAGSVSAENAQLKQEIASDYYVIGVVTASLSSSDEV